jgi:hypothetical protein
MLGAIYADCHYAEFHQYALYTEHHYAECRFAKCHYAECRGALCNSADRRLGKCHGAVYFLFAKLHLFYSNESSFRGPRP